MSKTMTDDELHQHLCLAKDYLDEYLAELEHGSPDQKKRAQLLGYWVGDYINFLRKETTFDPKKLIRYKRGSIVKAHLGYRIGSEEGGLHYAIVIDNNNALSSSAVTVIPLTSIKPNTDLSKLHFSKINLGDEIYKLLEEKLSSSIPQIKARTVAIGQQISDVMSKVPAPGSPEYNSWLSEYRVIITEATIQIEKMNAELDSLDKVKEELQRMKAGSIALVGQITTISKIRIYDPLYPSDVFTNVRVSPESMDKIDNKITALYTKKT